MNPFHIFTLYLFKIYFNSRLRIALWGDHFASGLSVEILCTFLVSPAPFYVPPLSHSPWFIYRNKMLGADAVFLSRPRGWLHSVCSWWLRDDSKATHCNRSAAAIGAPLIGVQHCFRNSSGRQSRVFQARCQLHFLFLCTEVSFRR
jgi:hypothetical protein